MRQPARVLIVVLPLFLLAVPLLAQTGPRFAAARDGVIRDSKTGLEWVVGPDWGTDYERATKWVAGCDIAGGGWRMPTVAELQGLYAKGAGEHNMGKGLLNLDPVFRNTGWWEMANPWVWAKSSDSAEAKKGRAALFDFEMGEADYTNMIDARVRAFGVRAMKK